MNFKCFHLDDGFPSEFIENPVGLELLKKNFGFRSKKLEGEKFKACTSLDKVSDLLDLEIRRTKVLGDCDRLWNSVTRDQRFGKLLLSGRRCPSGTGAPRAGAEGDRLWSGFNVDAERTSRKSFDPESESDVRSLRNLRFSRKSVEKSYGCGPDDGYAFAGAGGSFCPGSATFPDRSRHSTTSSDAAPGNFFGRSTSTYSEDSVCTEKSADCSTISETLPDGGSKIQSENSETWLRKSTSGTTISEKRIHDSTTKEKSENKLCDISTKKTFHAERSATGSSIQEKSTSETTASSSSDGVKSTEHKMSSRSTVRKMFRPTEKAFAAQDKPAQYSLTDEEWRQESGYTAREGTTGAQSAPKLVNEDDMPLGPGADMGKLGCDYAVAEKLLENEKRQGGTERFRGARAEDEKALLDQNFTWSKLNDLEAENEGLQQENSKLQSIVQDVTAVNKRWQKYNDERRLYVQKLLSMIQDLQEQINLISEKSAFSRSMQDKSSFTYEDVEKMKRGYEEHLAELELRIKSHKEEWDAERKEKEKVVREKENLELKVEELVREIKFLSGLLREEKRRAAFCPSCRREETPQSEMLSAAPSLPGPQSPFLAPAHIPYGTRETPPKESLQFRRESTGQQLKLLSKRDNSNNFVSEPFTECFSFSRGQATGGTIVVENERGLRLAITEKYPFKGSLQLKSILKKQDRKARNFSKLVPEQTKAFDDSVCSMRNRVAIAREDLEEAKGLDKEELAPGENYPPGYGPCLSNAAELLDVRSKSEPNTRSNSSENLQPLRESSSWNCQCVSADSSCAGAVCLKCESSRCPSIFPQCPTDF